MINLPLLALEGVSFYFHVTLWVISDWRALLSLTTTTSCLGLASSWVHGLCLHTSMFIGLSRLTSQFDINEGRLSIWMNMGLDSFAFFTFHFC